jgi:hypothetical protein
MAAAIGFCATATVETARLAVKLSARTSLMFFMELSAEII